MQETHLYKLSEMEDSNLLNQSQLRAAVDWVDDTLSYKLRKTLTP